MPGPSTLSSKYARIYFPGGSKQEDGLGLTYHSGTVVLSNIDVNSDLVISCAFNTNSTTTFPGITIDNTIEVAKMGESNNGEGTSAFTRILTPTAETVSIVINYAGSYAGFLLAYQVQSQ